MAERLTADTAGVPGTQEPKGSHPGTTLAIKTEAPPIFGGQQQGHEQKFCFEYEYALQVPKLTGKRSTTKL